MFCWEIFRMSNVGRSEITPELEFYRHLLLWHALSGSLHAVHFSFPRRQVVVLFCFLFIRALTTGRTFASSFVKAASALSLSAAEVTLCPFIPEALSLSAGAGGGAAPNARTYRRPVASKLSRTRRLPHFLLLSPACWWKI